MIDTVDTRSESRGRARNAVLVQEGTNLRGLDLHSLEGRLDIRIIANLDPDRLASSLERPWDIEHIILAVPDDKSLDSLTPIVALAKEASLGRNLSCDLVIVRLDQNTGRSAYTIGPIS